MQKIIFANKNFGAPMGLSHIGLGIAGLNTVKCLRHIGYDAEVWPITSGLQLFDRLLKTNADHVIISAPWIPAEHILNLATRFPNTTFTITCHSNLAFLAADPQACKILRETVNLERVIHNVHIAGNSQRFCDWLRDAFNAPCAFLPNLYFVPHHYSAMPNVFKGGDLRIGMFGATRALKNMMTGAAAAILIARQVRAPLQLWISDGRSEDGGGVLHAVRQMIYGMPDVTLKLNPWQTWPEFRQTVAHMNLLLQPSFTESFNITIADGVAESVPAAVSTAITWMPNAAKADPDDTTATATAGRMAIFDPLATTANLAALRKYVADGLASYVTYFAG